MRANLVRVVAAAVCVATISCTGSSTRAATPTPTTETSLKPGTQDVAYTVGGQPRTAVVAVPTELSHAVPLVFVFHGHGGTGHDIQGREHIEQAWPEAVVAYPN